MTPAPLLMLLWGESATPLSGMLANARLIPQKTIAAASSRKHLPSPKEKDAATRCPAFFPHQSMYEIPHPFV